jgi:hypothetical protein
VKGASGTTLVSESTHAFLDYLGLIPNAGRDLLFFNGRYFDRYRHLIGAVTN